MNRPTTSPRFLARALLALSVTTALLATSQTASAQEVLLIYDVTGQCTPDLQTALTNAGMTVTLSDTSETAYNGTNPSPANFDAVIHLNGTTYNTEMPVAGQNALVDYVVNDGGGFIHTEWDAYEIDDRNRMLAMEPITILERTSGREGTNMQYNITASQSSHPVVENVPSTFIFVPMIFLCI